MAVKSLNIDSKYSINNAFPGFSMDHSLIMTNNNRVYWICQLSGWSLWAILNIVGILSFDLFSLGKVVILLFAAFAGLCFTHILRNIIKKYSWVDLS